MIDKSSIISLRRKLEKEAWEIKSLGEIATEISKGKTIKKDQFGTGDYPVVYWPEILDSKECSNIVEFAHKTNLTLITNPKYCQYGDLLLSAYCKRIETLGKGVVYSGNKKPIIGDGIIKVEHNENPKFLLHSLSSSYVKKQIRNLIEDTVIVNLKIKHLQQIKIPLPPRHTQDKVINFLNKFSNLKERIEEELNRELENRKKQYEYYKETIFSSGMNIWNVITLDQILTKSVRGREVTKEQLGTGDYPAIKCGDINSEFKHSFERCLWFVNLELIKNPKFCEFGDILMGNLGSNDYVGKVVVYLGNEKPIVGDHVFLLKHQQNGRFLSYVLSSEFVREQIKAQSRGTIVMAIVKDSFQHIKIPLPSLEEQSKIVEVLDKLRISVEALQKEIPLLIEDLNKQYLYFQKQMLEP